MPAGPLPPKCSLYCFVVAALHKYSRFTHTSSHCLSCNAQNTFSLHSVAAWIRHGVSGRGREHGREHGRGQRYSWHCHRLSKAWGHAPVGNVSSEQACICDESHSQLNCSLLIFLQATATVRNMGLSVSRFFDQELGMVISEKTQLLPARPRNMPVEDQPFEMLKVEAGRMQRAAPPPPNMAVSPHEMTIPKPREDMFGIGLRIAEKAPHTVLQVSDFHVYRCLHVTWCSKTLRSDRSRDFCPMNACTQATNLRDEHMHPINHLVSKGDVLKVCVRRICGPFWPIGAFLSLVECSANAVSFSLSSPLVLKPWCIPISIFISVCGRHRCRATEHGRA